MRKVVFSVIVVVLAGACWVVAQNATTNQVSPYGQQRAPVARVNSTEPPAPPQQAAAAKGEAPTGAAESTDAPLEPLPVPVHAPAAPTAMALPVPSNDGNLVSVPVVPVSEQAPAAMQIVAPPSPTPVPVPNPGDAAPPSPPAAPVPPAQASVPQEIPTPMAMPAPPMPPPVVVHHEAPAVQPPVIAPPSQSPPIPPAPAPQNVSMPPLAPAPATSAPPVAPQNFTIPVVAPPQSVPNPAIIAQVNAASDQRTVAQAPPPDVPQAPVMTQPAPVPPLPPVPERPRVRSATQPAVPIIPMLPAVPGVAADYTGMPGYAASMQGPGTVVPNATQLPLPSTTPMPPLTAIPGWTTDAPTANASGQEVFGDSPGRVLGPHVWFNAEYLYWFVKTQTAPPLVQAINGVQPGDTGYSSSQVSNLFPGSTKDNTNAINGARGTLGFWLNSTQTFGFEASYFWLGENGVHDNFYSSPGVILGRPFINADTGQNVLYQVSSLDGVNGTIRVDSKFHAEGGDANFLMNSMSVGPRLNLLAGFRYLDVSESICVESVSTNPANNFLAQSYDLFGTTNQFFGGQLGLRWNYEGPRLLFGITTKIAYGLMEERIRINGGSYLQNANGISTAGGGVLAQSTNIGAYNHSTSAYIPEGNATIGYRFAPWATAFVGYNFMYVSNVVRPGKQINSTVNPENLPFASGGPGATQPSFMGFHQESLWLQGITLGMSLRY